MGPIGVPEMMVIVVIALILFGPKKLPELGRTLGKAMTEFRRATSDLKGTFEREMRNLEQEVDAEKKPPAAPATNAAAQTTDSGYDDEYEDPYSPEPQDNASTSAVSDSEAPAGEAAGHESAAQQSAAQQSAEEPVARAEPVPGVEGTVARSEPAPQRS